MRTADFDYDLPPARIAQTPVEPRDAARLLVDWGDRVEHRHVRDLPELLRPGDLVVVNDTRVIPARLHLQRATGGRVEVVLVESLDAAGTTWLAMARPAKRLRVGEELVDASGRAVLAVGPRHDELVEVRLLNDAERSGGAPGPDWLAELGQLGEVPLPPYITTPLADPDRYQTVYARRPGSVAAPTAGLHLTPRVLDDLAARGIDVAKVELVVGLDTFKPVVVDDPRQHVVHTERYHVDPEVLAACHATRAAGGRVVAVGTTTVRALETAAAGPPSGRTSLFIHRPYEWRLVDVLLTNFHLPRTSLLMMVDAFIGPRWRELYAVALAEGYRFLSFGDAMLLERR